MFHLNVYREGKEEVVNTISSLFSLGYKNIKVRFDGTRNKELSEWLLSNGAKVLHGRRLKAKGNGGLITHCYLSSFMLTSKDDYLIKIDPDTQPKYPLFRYPEDKIGCNFNPDYQHIYGGCIVFPRRIVEKIVLSELLLDRKYKESKWNYNNHKLKEHLSCQDMIIYDVLVRLGIGIDYMSDQILARNERDSITPNKEYCFVHIK